MPLKAGGFGPARDVPKPNCAVIRPRGEPSGRKDAESGDRPRVPLEAGDLGTGRGKRGLYGHNGRARKDLARHVEKPRFGEDLEPRQTPDQLRQQLERIAGADAADEAQSPADEALRLADAVKLIVGGQRLRVRGRLKLRLEPGGVEQQRVKLRALVRRGEVMREKQVIVAPRARVGLCARGAVEGPGKLRVQGDKAVLPGPISQEVPGRIVQTEEALPQIEIEQQRKVEKPTELVFRVYLVEITGRRPQALNDPHRDLRVLGKHRKLTETRPLRLGQQIEADADRARNGLGALRLITWIEDAEPFGVEPPVRAGDRHGQRFAGPDHAVA